MNKNLLLISSNKADISSIQSILDSKLNYVNYDVVYNHEDTFHAIENKSPDLIILDIDFPELTFDKGLQLINQILSFKRLPVIVMSTNNNIDKIFNEGAISFVQKPFTDLTFISNLITATKLIDNYKAIEKQEKEIKKKNKRINIQIEKERKQSEIITKKNTDIMADIRYASRIQHAILPQLDFIQNNIFEYFILHQPKSHVGGDFYWVSPHWDQMIVAVGDCTGHGISGALMHMLAAVYLNEIITSNTFLTASDILEQLRDHIMRSLNQKGDSGEAQDGLDIALVIIDYKKQSLQFAGANNPIYIIRNKELIEIKGDRMPVGIHVNFDKPFINHEIELKSNDKIYLFSDGYADQFGGPRGKKFRYKQFKELLINNSHEPMQIQKEILNNVHDKWRGSLDQIDDILVFGLKIK